MGNQFGFEHFFRPCCEFKGKIGVEFGSCLKDKHHDRREREEKCPCKCFFINRCDRWWW